MRSKPMLERHSGAKSWLVIAKSSNEQDGYERTSDAAGARLAPDPLGHLAFIEIAKPPSEFQEFSGIFFRGQLGELPVREAPSPESASGQNMASPRS